MTKKGSTAPNVQRSNVKNSNNPAYSADRVNRIQQGHGNAPPPAQPKQPAPTSNPKK